MGKPEVDGWYYRVWRGQIGFVAECKRTPFEGKAGHWVAMMQEVGDIYFEFGATEDEALRNLRASER